MLASEIIRKKRDGKKLSAEEIAFIVQGAATGSLPDYQISAWLMATYLKGNEFEETLMLTRAMKDSGETLHWRKLSSKLKDAVFVDKHSTGGVGDKVSLVLAPLVAAFGLKVPMMSGRGLGFTGGTVDKLESIPGFSMYPSREKMVQCLEDVGVAMMAQAPTLCPADKKLYALRDVTSTIENVSLITASILSKKWAEGVDAIVFDVKCGEGAFMTRLEEAQTLSKSLVTVATMAGLKAKACITKMDEPLGALVGNVLEVQESLYILKSEYPSDEHRRLAEPLKNLCVGLAAEMACLAGACQSLDTAFQRASEHLESGRALEIFYKMCQAQGAQSNWEAKLLKADKIIDIKSKVAGYVEDISSRTLGLLGLELGIGRKSMEEKVDPAAGFELLKGVGDTVAAGDILLRVHLKEHALKEEHAKKIEAAFKITPKKISPSTNYIIEGIVADHENRGVL